MAREKSITIPIALFTDLVKYHLLDIDEVEFRIKKGLEEKFESMKRHELYTKIKTVEDAEQKEQARQQYLDAKGIPKEFRW